MVRYESTVPLSLSLSQPGTDKNCETLRRSCMNFNVERALAGRTAEGKNS